MKTPSTRRKLTFESLETRLILASDLQNPLIAEEEDVNDDGAISPIDVLQVINHLKRQAAPNSVSNNTVNPSSSYVDVDGDGTVAPIDVLRVINRLAKHFQEIAVDLKTTSSGLVQGALLTSLSDC